MSRLIRIFAGHTEWADPEIFVGVVGWLGSCQRFLVISGFHRGPYKPPSKSNCALRVCISILRKPIATCVFPGSGSGPHVTPHSGSAHALVFPSTSSFYHLSHGMTNNQCAQSEDSDQTGHLPSLVRVFALCSVGNYGPKLWTSKTLIRLN